MGFGLDDFLFLIPVDAVLVEHIGSILQHLPFLLAELVVIADVFTVQLCGAITFVAL